MATKYGVGDSRLNATPTNIDLDELNLYRTADGVGIGEIIGWARGEAARFNAFDWPNHPHLASLIGMTTYLSPEDRIDWTSGNMSWQEYTEAGSRPSERRDRLGNQAYPQEFSLKIGYTWTMLRRAKADQIISDIASGFVGAVEKVRQVWVRRIMLEAADNFAGSAYSVGWVGATNNTDYEPPVYEGKSFASHDHIVDTNYADSAAGRRALFGALYDHLDEHGQRSLVGAPIVLLHGSDTRADVEADAQYLAGPQSYVSYDATTIGRPEVYAHGVLKDDNVLIAQVGGIPDNYFSQIKSYGMNNPRNPLRLWYPEDLGWGIQFLNLDTSPPENVSPIQNLEMYLQFGVAVQVPEGGVAGMIGSSGTWSDPTTT